MAEDRGHWTGDEPAGIRGGLRIDIGLVSIALHFRETDRGEEDDDRPVTLSRLARAGATNPPPPSYIATAHRGYRNRRACYECNEPQCYDEHTRHCLHLHLTKAAEQPATSLGLEASGVGD